MAGPSVRVSRPSSYRDLRGARHASLLWTKTAHLVFVMAWMGGVFYLPRILVNLAEAGDEPAVRARLVLMGRRLYRFGHIMFGLAVVFGLCCGWYRVCQLPTWSRGGWLHAKLALVAVMLAHYIVARTLAEGRRCRPRAAFVARVALVQRIAGAAAGGDRLPGAGQAVLMSSSSAGRIAHCVLKASGSRQLHRHAIGVAVARRAQLRAQGRRRLQHEVEDRVLLDAAAHRIAAGAARPDADVLAAVGFVPSGTMASCM